MRRYRFPIAVAATSLALIIALGVVGALTVRSALANAPWAGGVGFGGHGFGGPGFGGPGFELPPELQGLRDLPPAERFAHFVGVQVSLKDKDNKPLTANITPGTATAVSATSLTIAANDGTTKTFTLNDRTIIGGKAVQGGAQAAQPTLTNGDLVVIVTLGDTRTARAVMNGGKDGFARGPFGPHR